MDRENKWGGPGEVGRTTQGFVGHGGCLGNILTCQSLALGSCLPSKEEHWWHQRRDRGTEGKEVGNRVIQRTSSLPALQEHYHYLTCDFYPRSTQDQSATPDPPQLALPGPCTTFQLCYGPCCYCEDQGLTHLPTCLWKG